MSAEQGPYLLDVRQLDGPDKHPAAHLAVGMACGVLAVPPAEALRTSPPTAFPPAPAGPPPKP